MFVPTRWAQGFVNAAAGRGDAVNGAGDTVNGAGDTRTAFCALELVKVMGPVLLSVKGHVAGTVAARRLGQLIHRVFAAVPPEDRGPESRSRELALGLMLLLVQRNLLNHIDQLIGVIEQELDSRQGILRAHLEFAQDPGAEFLDQLKKSLMAKTGAAGVRLSTSTVPALLAGCRLRIGSDRIDASLQTRLKELEADLAATAQEVFDGRL
jgi:hypothetical protein